MGDVIDFSNYMGAIIDGHSFAKRSKALEPAEDHELSVIAGGTSDL